MRCSECDRPGVAKDLCSTHYARVRRASRPRRRIVVRGPLAHRLWAKVDKSGGATACWLWTAYRSRHGYGQLAVDRGGKRWRSEPAHRVAWELTNGPIGADLFICHACDNPPCCNPAHLFVGTSVENVADMDRKGRRVTLGTGTRGEDNGMSKVTAAIVSAIRSEYVPMRRGSGLQAGSQRALAERYGVTQSTVGRIVLRQTWRHVS